MEREERWRGKRGERRWGIGRVGGREEGGGGGVGRGCGGSEEFVVITF